MVRKTVTVLFADVTGSTGMGERLDPEALRRVMTRYFEASRATLERHGATVEKFIGDAVMAVFGVPAVHEDDALRAARAALELRGEVSALGIELRIGVNTGEVVTEEGETLITGDAVNVAARLDQAASPGEILLGDPTYRIARDALRVEAVMPVEARGKTEPVAAWRLLDVLDDAPAFTRPLDVPFVGRREELGQLLAAFERATQGNAAQRVTLLGAPGIGKSRLARELAQRVMGEARVVVGRCLAYGEGITYWPLTEIVRATAGAERDAIAAVSADELVADRIAAAIGVGGAAGTKEETQWAARRYLEVLAAERPLVLDDLHWAEPTFLDLVEYVADFGAAPILLLCTARSELLDALRRAARRAPRGSRRRPRHPPDVAGVAGGAPRLAHAPGAGCRRVRLRRRASLPPRLCRGTRARGRAARGRCPPAGARSQGIRPPRPRAVPGDDGYRFAHILVRDAAHEGISKELRAGLHERFVDWLERVAADRLGELEEVVAYHLEQAALYRRELDLPDEREAGRRAAELLVRSGMRAYDRGDLPAAEHLLSRAVSLRPQGDRLRVRALPLLGATILDAAGGMERALDILGRALDESRIAGDRAAEASAWALRNLVRQQSEPALDLEAMQRDVEKRAPEIERLGDGRALVYLRRLELSMALRRLSGLGAAAERLLAAARSAGDRRNALEAVYFLNAWWVVGPMPVEEALAATQRMRALAQGPAEEVAVGHMEGLLLGMRGELDEGRRLIREARAAYAELGVTLTAVASARDEALIERYAGDPAAVERVLRPACDELREAGETGYLSTHVGEFADALYELGRYGEAEEACLESERLTQEGDIYSQVVWRRVRAKLLAQKGKGDEALRLAREAIEWAEKDMPEPLGDAYRDLAEVERTAGHAGRAEEALERALATYERKGLVPMAERTRGELATLRANV